MFLFRSLLNKWGTITICRSRFEARDDAEQLVEELIALVGDFATAQHTYDEAVKRRPGKLITLRQKARVIKKSR